MLKNLFQKLAGVMTLVMVLILSSPLLSQTALKASADELLITNELNANEPAMFIEVGVNIKEGGFKVLKNGQTIYDPMQSNYNQGCGKVGNYYVCKVTAQELGVKSPGELKVLPYSVEGYTVTPEYQGIQFDGVNDVAFFDYEKVIPENPETNFVVKTQDNQGNPLNEQYIRNALTTHNTPDSFSEKLANLNNFSFEFKNKPGYTKPGTLVISNKIINSLPSGVSVLENGANYALGTVLKANATYTITGTYIKQEEPYNGQLFTIDKQIVSEVSLGNGNKQVDYKITVTRDANGPTGNYSILVDDSVNDNGNRTLYGSNGGTMKVVPTGNNVYSVCSNGCGDITLNPVNVLTTQPGQKVTITYRMVSDNSNIPTGQTSNFTNTVVGKYKDGNGNKQVSDQVTTTVPGTGNNAGNLYTVTKNASETILADGNKQVDYTITVKRNNNSPTGTYSILVDDSVNDQGNRTIYGSNGGSMTVVPVNGSYSKCSNNCGDITLNPVNVTTTQPGQVVTITYRMKSNKSGIPANQTSNFTNTVVGNYVQDGQNKTTTDKVTVTVPEEGTEADLFTVTKTATEVVLANGNKRVTYQITVRRNLNGPTGTYYILVDDTVNDNGNRTLNGSNGGTMTVVKRTDGTYSTCSTNCGDITAGPVNVKTTAPGDVVTMTYEMVSDNSTIPNNQTSNFVNTALGKYTQDGQNKTTSGQVTVTVGKNIYVPAPTPTPTPTPAPPSPTPPSTPKNGPGGILMLLILSGLGAYAWQTLANRRKAALIK